MKNFIFFILLITFPSTHLSADEKDVYEGLSNFTKVLDLIERNYVDEVDSKQLTTDAIEGMLKSLDPYSVYLTKEKFKELEIDTYGEFGGIGVELTVKNGILTVITPIVGSPAYNAGVRPGDQVLSIDGKSTENMSTYDAAKLLRGKRGTEVRILIESEDSNEPKEIVLEREVIRITSVESRLVGTGIGYIKLIQFQKKSSAEFNSAYKDLTEQNGDELNGLIVDLRNNPGGLLDQAIEVADQFIKSGVLVSVRGRSQYDTKDYHATTGTIIPDIPVVVLLNKGSASASEVVAGALRDNNIATILGTKSFGKGSVQTIVELEDGSGVKLTTARFYTPSGDKINNVGIAPDIEVQENDKRDIQLERAVEIVASKP